MDLKREVEVLTKDLGVVKREVGVQTKDLGDIKNLLNLICHEREKAQMDKKIMDVDGETKWAIGIKKEIRWRRRIRQSVRGIGKRRIRWMRIRQRLRGIEIRRGIR